MCPEACLKILLKTVLVVCAVVSLVRSSLITDLLTADVGQSLCPALNYSDSLCEVAGCPLIPCGSLQVLPSFSLRQTCNFFCPCYLFGFLIIASSERMPLIVRNSISSSLGSCYFSITFADHLNSWSVTLWLTGMVTFLLEMKLDMAVPRWGLARYLPRNLCAFRWCESLWLGWLLEQKERKGYSVLPLKCPRVAYIGQ